MSEIRGARLEKSAVITIYVFLACEAVNLVIAIAKVVTISVSDEKESPWIRSSYAVTLSLVYFVLYYYTYQMRLVALKITSQTPEHLKRQILISKIVWIALILEQFMSIVLQILEAFEYISDEKSPFFKYLNRGLTILTEGFLIIC
jgi:hypothetical protein